MSNYTAAAERRSHLADITIGREESVPVRAERLLQET